MLIYIKLLVAEMEQASGMGSKGGRYSVTQQHNIIFLNTAADAP